MPWPTSAELDHLVAGFRDRTLPKVAWTHRTHLAVGTWHVWHYGPAEALRRLRVGIRQLNDAHGTPNMDTSGYHETMTRAYVSLISKALSAQPGNTALAQCAQALLASPLAAKDALLIYYSKELLMSVAARRDWREPDQNALDLLDPEAHVASPNDAEDRPSES